MKKFIFTLTIIVVAIVGTTTFANAATNNNVATVLNTIGNFNKIEVRGNVELIVANGEKNEVTVGNNYYAENALVQGKDGVLRISSYGADKLVVYIKAADLRAISAFDNAVVKSDGRLSAIQLNVELSNNAYASLNLDNFSACVTLNDNAKAEITGSANEFALNYSETSTFTRSSFVADNITEAKVASKAVIAKVAQKTDDLVIVED